MTPEQQWAEEKAQVEADIVALVSVGIPLDTAKRLANWNITLAYDSFSEVTQWPPAPVISVPAGGFRKYLRLLVSRSDSRANPGTLEGAVLDAGKLYAIFIPDIPELNILDITFELNGSPVHHEFSAPWDYAGTAPGGEANRITFVAGSYEIEAIVNATGGPYSFNASFDVE